jgi:hypothetical protein
MNDTTAQDTQASVRTLPQDDFTANLKGFVRGASQHFAATTENGSHELVLVQLRRFDDQLADAAAKIVVLEGDAEIKHEVLKELAALRRSIGIEVFAREHCVLGGMDDLEAARERALDDYENMEAWPELMRSDQMMSYLVDNAEFIQRSNILIAQELDVYDPAVDGVMPREKRVFEVSAATDVHGEWLEVAIKDNGKPVNNKANVAACFDIDPQLKIFAYDEMRRGVYLTKPVPGTLEAVNHDASDLGGRQRDPALCPAQLSLPGFDP